jgi:hypothetical protein
VLVTDQTVNAKLGGMTGTTGGGQWISQTDALGRLTSVWEVTPADQ